MFDIPEQKGAGKNNHSTNMRPAVKPPQKVRMSEYDTQIMTVKHAEWATSAMDTLELLAGSSILFDIGKATIEDFEFVDANGAVKQVITLKLPEVDVKVMHSMRYYRFEREYECDGGTLRASKADQHKLELNINRQQKS